VSTFTLPKVPSLPRIFGLPNGWSPDNEYGAPPQQEKPPTDEFGLATAVYGHAPRQSRQFVSLCLETLNKPKNIPPSFIFGVSAGTIPELCTFGYLINEGFNYRQSGVRSFSWLSYELGAGNIEAGTQLDFSVYIGPNRRIGVDVDSVFHSVKNPYGAGQKLEQDRRRRQRLLSAGGLANVISVNRAPQHALEHGPNELVVPELRRILAA
jgi:hypothetical protein